MTDPNFSPTGQPQNLPGMDVPAENNQGSVPNNNENTVENVVNVPPPTTPPQVQIEYPAPDETGDQKSHRTTIAYGIAVFFLIIVLIFGIMLIVWTIPKIVSSLNNFGKLPVPSTTPTHTTPVATSIPYTSATSTATSTKPIVISGPADLRVRILAVNPIGNDVSVRFDVKNIGERTSGVWSFSVSLPSTVTPIYHSSPQQPIAPQSGLINTLQFTPNSSLNNQIGQITVKIFAEPGETNANNNVASYILY